ncbi:hypothetical protein [Kerstersia gyiorum]|uniref:hypothetical protein n=1 Tax=Kerstersia gyiorum TaxID=206506 RepID=UPI0030D627C5
MPTSIKLDQKPESNRPQEQIELLKIWSDFQREINTHHANLAKYLIIFASGGIAILAFAYNAGLIEYITTKGIYGNIKFLIPLMLFLFSTLFGFGALESVARNSKNNANSIRKLIASRQTELPDSKVKAYFLTGVLSLIFCVCGFASLLLLVDPNWPY